MDKNLKQGHENLNKANKSVDIEKVLPGNKLETLKGELVGYHSKKFRSCQVRNNFKTCLQKVQTRNKAIEKNYETISKEERFLF